MAAPFYNLPVVIYEHSSFSISSPACIVMFVWSLVFFLILTQEHFWCRLWPAVSVVLWMRRNKFTWSTEILWRRRDGVATLSRGEHLDRLALTGFYWLSNSTHQRRFSFIMLGFALGNYFLQIEKERMLLITSYRLTRKKYCECKGTIRVIGLVTLHPWEN